MAGVPRLFAGIRRMDMKQLRAGCTKAKAVLAGLAVMVLFAGLPVFGQTTWTISNLNDSGTGSVRDAIAGASSGDTINFSVSGTIGVSIAGLLISLNVTI